MFADREDAGRRLAEKLDAYRGRNDVTVVALPRGGVVLGRIVADALNAPLDIVVPRKIGAPGNEEYAVGAVTESGHVVWNEAERARLDDDYAERTVAEERAEAQRRLDIYRAGRPPRDWHDRTVIVVDDGIATGYTMRAAIETVRSMKPRRVIVAVPVAPADSIETLRGLGDEIVVLETPTLFFAIGAHYSLFNQVDDETVVALMRRS
ncbi:MAG: phosphoribosyltransferase [Patescibacteria group bacterium]|nr:phosphoribosyltransferase [Patescibacteria group bacterium]